MQSVAALRVALVVLSITSGLGFVFGPASWRSSRSYAVIGDWLPLRGWGVVFLVTGLVQAALLIALVCLRRSTIGSPLPDSAHLVSVFAAGAFVAGAATSAMWAVALVDTALIGQLTGVNGPGLWSVTTVANLVVAFDLAARVT